MTTPWPVDRVTVVIPTRNSSGWICRLNSYYRQLSVPVTYFVDERSEDNTLAILGKIGANTIPIVGDQDVVESFIFKLSDHVNTPWILRLDDDECPSRKLIEWVGMKIDQLTGNVVSLPRKWIRFTAPGRLEFLGNRSWDWEDSTDGEDRQYRLYRKDEVRYSTEIHTPGFEVDYAIESPSDAVIFHLDWIVRTRAERLAKMAQYDSVATDAGIKNARFYLPEDVIDWDYRGMVSDPDVLELADGIRRSLRSHRLIDRISRIPNRMRRTIKSIVSRRRVRR